MAYLHCTTLEVWQKQEQWIHRGHIQQPAIYKTKKHQQAKDVQAKC